ncbi:hypothetical protein ACTXQV_68275, partial [Klebsiella pneumoniae]
EASQSPLTAIFKMRACTQARALFFYNIQARFSRYYARQGQPDIDYSSFMEEKIAMYGVNT